MLKGTLTISTRLGKTSPSRSATLLLPLPQFTFGAFVPSLSDRVEHIQKSSVSLGDVARAANVSVTAAGFALRNRPGVGSATRKRILDAAHRLNYFPDARLASTMAGIRQTVSKDLLPVVWFNAHSRKNAWHEYSFLSPYLEGARERLQENGYRLEEIWTKDPAYSMRRIAQIIESQGIEGAIVSNPAKHIRLNWKLMTGVAIGGGILAPALHRIDMDTNFNLALALKSLKRIGYQRIGVCLSEEADRFSRHASRSTTLYFNSTIPRSRRVTPLFLPYLLKPNAEKPLFAVWLKKEKPDVVVGHSSHLISWVESAGFRVPQNIGVAHLAIEDDVLDWAGVYGNKREIGRLAASKLISLMHQRQFGVPPIASSELVPGIWRTGRTILH
jgi:LacI family transcriptional regulator